MDNSVACRMSVVFRSFFEKMDITLKGMFYVAQSSVQSGNWIAESSLQLFTPVTDLSIPTPT